MALLTGRRQSQTSHAQGGLGSPVAELRERLVAIATRQHLGQAVLDSGIVGGCEVSGVGRRQCSQQVRASGSCAVYSKIHHADCRLGTCGIRLRRRSWFFQALRELRGDELAAAHGATQDYHALLGRWDGPVSCPAGVLRVLRG